MFYSREMNERTDVFRTRGLLAVLVLACALAGTAPAAARQHSASPAPQRPPAEAGPVRKVDLVDLARFDKTLRLDVRYATPNNFLGRAVYPRARAFLQKDAAEALARANQRLRQRGYGIIVFDGYRPWSVTKTFWDETPPEKRAFVSDPSKGSRHNRGAAVDVSLFDVRTGREAEMPSGYDDFSERAHPAYAGGTEESRRLRDELRRAMEAEGFTVYENEWWHFDYKTWREYPILDVPFGEL